MLGVIALPALTPTDEVAKRPNGKKPKLLCIE
jgi:hypothetical protein